MISYIHKVIGFGLLGAGAVGTSIAYGVSKLVPESVSILLGEEDRQWQFLYELSKKVFNFLKSQSELLDADDKNAIKWLKDKFSSSLENEDDKWENFKTLCKEQQLKETNAGTYVNNYESRLCFMDKPTDSDSGVKGNLNLWILESSSSLSNLFRSWNKKNYELWEFFKFKYPDENPIDKFNEWYDAQIENDNQKKISNIKNILRQ